MSVEPSDARVTGINHLTLAVTDLDRSLAFYRDVLGCRVRASWKEGAYLTAGDLWLCLSLDDKAKDSVHADYSHVAFSVAEEHFAALTARITGVTALWKENRSEGASTYFLDPDGHRLELHVGTLQSRLDHYLAHPAKGVSVFAGSDDRRVVRSGTRFHPLRSP